MFDKAAENLFYEIDWYIDDTTNITKTTITQTPDDGNSDLREKDIGHRNYGFNVRFKYT